MPTSIPYDSSLQLTGIVPKATLDILEQISAKQAPVDAAQEGLNSAIQTVRSLEMTMQEMTNMGVDASGKDVADSLKAAKKNVQTAAKKLIDAKLAAWEPIMELKGKLQGVTDALESPVDYNRVEIKKLPLSADSLTMDAQYFSHDQEREGASNSLMAIRSFVSESTKFLGDKQSSEATGAVQRQVSSQIEHHDIEGTLIITAACTHKLSAVLAPFALDVDKAIRVFNKLFPDDMIKTNDPASIAKIAMEQQTKEEKTFELVSGANYGSSFIGMVHVLRSSDTRSSQKMISTAASLRGQMEVSAWFESMKGGFGVDSSFANDAKKLLSSQDISSHISVVCMGIIPSIVSNQVQLGVKQFADFDPAKMMGQLATVQNATASDISTVGAEAQKAKTGQTMSAIQGQTVKSVMSGLQDSDDGQNKMLDINSLMTAFEDYVNKAIDGEAGVPVTYYLKPITASQLAQMWVAKYYPGEYVTSAGDDTKLKEPKSGGGGDEGDDDES